jgi:fimbrial isopeptide formation D2 family protein/LPXTG-motif cell wall-anchored protein
MNTFIATPANNVSAVNTAANTKTNTDGSVTFDPGVLGYYLVTAAAKEPNGTAGNVESAVILGSNDVDITSNLKLDVPSITKQVSVDADSTGAGDYGLSGQTGIGDTVTFQLSAPIPDMYDYTTYNFIMHDTLSPGLDPITISDGSSKNIINVQVLNPDGSVNATATGLLKYTVGTDSLIDDNTIPSGSSAFKIDFGDIATSLQPYAGDTIVVTYTTELNDSAKISDINGGQPNPNWATLEYSNNPYNTDTTTTTPDQRNDVYTYQLNILKYAGKINSDGTTITNETTLLPGAEFSLTTSNTSSSTDVLTFTGSNGSYIFAPTGTVTTLDTITGGTIDIAGLAPGTYYLWETKAPDGYNALTAPVTIVISSAITNTNGTGGTSTDVSSDLYATPGALDVSYSGTYTDDGTFIPDKSNTVDVQDTTGTQLPGTGGMGTTIFYAVGGIIVLGALIVLITRRRTDDGTNNA